jgi:hypothetical protein
MQKILYKYVADTNTLEKYSPELKAIAQRALPLAVDICRNVDAAIEKMKPLGGG